MILKYDKQCLQVRVAPSCIGICNTPISAAYTHIHSHVYTVEAMRSCAAQQRK